jgi:selenocysteine-specific translation elongation factor
MENTVKNIAKKDSETDIKYYSRKVGENIWTFLVPFRFPEKIFPLTLSASISQAAIVKVDEFSKDLGEVILSLDSFGIKHGAIICDSYKKSTITKIAQGTVLENYQYISNDMASLISFIESLPYDNIDKKGYVVVDQYFVVKGTGTVALGFVKEGRINKHDTIRIYPSEKEAEIRSIQSHDVEITTAENGTRVGLALKNANVEDLEKGTILSNNTYPTKKSITIEFKKYPVSYEIQKGQKIHIDFLMNDINAEITELKNGQLTLELPKEIPIINGMPIAIVYLDRVPRIYGKGTIVH